MWKVAITGAALAVTAALLPCHTVFAQSPIPTDVARVLEQAGSFSASDLSAVQSGQVITKTTASPENLEASVVTAVRIRTTKDRTFDYFRTLVSYVDGQVTTGYGTVSRSPSEEDLAKLKLDSADLNDLRSCRPDLCDIRIGSASPSEIAQAVDWQASDALERAATWVRQRLAAYVTDYLKRGDAALVSRDERAMPVDLKEQWRAIFNRFSSLSTLAPGLEQYLTNFPAATPSEATDEIYWDKEHYTGLKPVIGLTHAVTWQDGSRPDRTVVAQRQIFANHYFYGSLAVTLFQQDTSGSTPVTYVVYLNRLRGDILKGTQAPAPAGLRARISSLGANIQRRFGEEMVKQSAERLLGAMKEALER